MRMEKVCIKGFRNFDDTEVIFQKKHLLKVYRGNSRGWHGWCSR